MCSNVILPMVVLVPLLGAVGVYLVPETYARRYALSVAFLVFLMTLGVLAGFDAGATMQYVSVVPFLGALGVSAGFGVDGISVLFRVLNAFLIPLCLLASWDALPHRLVCARFLLMEAFVNRIFVTTDLLIFYVAFEAVLIPMYVRVGLYGSRERKIRAAYFFFRFTFAGSIALLTAILYLWSVVGSRDMEVLKYADLDAGVERWLWLAFFLAFAVKVPMVPVHIWLPEAHVEAPTAGSVYLAGILLKRGTYGVLRLLIPRFPMSTAEFSPLVVMLCVVAILYASMTAIRQTDMKRIIAYASVAHMNMTLLGVFAMNSVGFSGGVIQMLNHGVVAGALFRCVGVLYDRYHTRLVSYYGGVVHFMPVYALLFRLFTMANIALPGTNSFVGEFLVFVGRFEWTTVGAVLSTTGLVLGGAYSRWLLNRVLYGNVNTQYLGWTPDRNRVEYGTLVPRALITVWMGIYPEPVLATMQASVDATVAHRTSHGPQ